MNKRKTDILELIIGIIVICVTCYSVYFFSIRNYAEYLNRKDTVVSQKAVVSRVYEGEDSDDDEYYDYYVTYEYEGKEYKDIYFTREYSDIYEKGAMLNIRIDSVDPAYIFHGKRGDAAFFIIFAIISVFMGAFENLFYYYKQRRDVQIREITDKMIAKDLRPKGLLIAAIAGICFGFSVLLGDKLMPELFGGIYIVWGVIFLIAGMVFQILALMFVKKKRNYTFTSRVCQRKWIDDSDDENIKYYAKFDELISKDLTKVEYIEMCEGSVYYLVINHRGKICNIYPASIWRPAIEDRSLIEPKRVLIKEIWLNLCIAVAVMAGIVGIMACATQILVK